jgi:phosphonate transport system substrate-binding protein
LQSRRDDFQKILVDMDKDEKGSGVLNALGFKSWQRIEDEEMEFMIDLMDTLNT